MRAVGVTIPSDHCITKLSNFDRSRSRISHVRPRTNYFQTLCASVVLVSESGGRGACGRRCEFYVFTEKGGRDRDSGTANVRREMSARQRRRKRETAVEGEAGSRRHLFDKQRRKSCRSAGAHPAIFISNQINRARPALPHSPMARLLRFSLSLSLFLPLSLPLEFYRNQLLEPRPASIEGVSSEGGSDR